MNEFTYAHLDAWVEKQFPREYDEDDRYHAIMAQMSAQYASDPALYDDVGWWRCYDDAVRP